MRDEANAMDWSIGAEVWTTQYGVSHITKVGPPSTQPGCEFPQWVYVKPNAFCHEVQVDPIEIRQTQSQRLMAAMGGRPQPEDRMMMNTLNGNTITIGWHNGRVRPVLFFAPADGTAANIAVALGCPRITSCSSPEVRDRIVKGFNAGHYHCIVVTAAMATGWTAPKDTKVVFLDGFTADPAVRAQCAARANRIG